LSRRRLLVGVAASATTLAMLRITAARGQDTQPLPAEALARLREGNQRFVRGNVQHPQQSAEQRRAIAPGQRPFATILGCADSRVPPEIVFDQGLGDLFVVRVAGNVVNQAVLGSIEYAESEWSVPAIMVLGHSNCGAVAATISVVTKGLSISGPIGDLIERIRPAVEEAIGQPGDLLENACRANVRLSMAALLRSEAILAAKESIGTLDLVGGYYDLETGAVDVFAT